MKLVLNLHVPQSKMVKSVVLKEDLVLEMNNFVVVMVVVIAIVSNVLMTNVIVQKKKHVEKLLVALEV